MAYTKVNWQNEPSTATPLNASNLNQMDSQYEAVADDISPGATNVATALTTRFGVTGVDSGIVSAGVFSAATGWSVDSMNVRKFGNVASGWVIFTRTGANITVPADGNIGNSSVATALSAWRPLVSVSMTSSSTGRGAWGEFNTSSGALNLCAVAPGGNITTGEQLQLSGTWLVAA